MAYEQNNAFFFFNDRHQASAKRRAAAAAGVDNRVIKRGVFVDACSALARVRCAGGISMAKTRWRQHRLVTLIARVNSGTLCWLPRALAPSSYLFAEKYQHENIS